MKILNGPISWAGFATATTVFGSAASVCSLLSLGKNHGTKVIPRVWGRSVLASCGVDLEVTGLDRFDHGGQYILASNHQSLLDPPAILAAAPLKVRFVAKASLFYLPLLGQAMWMVGNVPIDRRRTETSTRKLSRLGSKVGKGRSILFFPEGTRSLDERLLPLKKGAAVMAIQTGFPILPVALAGTGALLPKGAKVAARGRVAVAFGEPIPAAGLELSDRDGLTRKLRASLDELIPEAEALRQRG